jgi:hypothetical protein
MSAALFVCLILLRECDLLRPDFRSSACLYFKNKGEDHVDPIGSLPSPSRARLPDYADSSGVVGLRIERFEAQTASPFSREPASERQSNFHKG